jgi:hypothetical protein
VVTFFNAGCACELQEQRAPDYLGNGRAGLGGCGLDLLSEISSRVEYETGFVGSHTCFLVFILGPSCDGFGVRKLAGTSWEGTRKDPEPGGNPRGIS